MKIWEASGICLNLINKIKTHKVFEKKRNEFKQLSLIDNPLKINSIAFDSEYIAVAGIGGFVVLYKYNQNKANPVDDGLAELTVIFIFNSFNEMIYSLIYNSRKLKFQHTLKQ